MLSPQLPPEEEVPLNIQQEKDSDNSLSDLSLRNWVRFPALVQQARQLFPLILVCVAGVALVSFLTYLLSIRTGHRLDYLTKDPAAITGEELYLGLLSMAGVMMWGGMTGAAAAGALLPSTRLPARFFLSMAGLFLVLGLDDAYQLHEALFPNYLNVPESIVWLGYLFLIPGWLLFNSRSILKTGYLLLLSALGLLGLSLVTDLLVKYGERQTFIEDSFKLAGIVLLLVYTLHTVRLSMKPGDEPE